MIEICTATPELMARTRLPKPTRTMRALVAVDTETQETVGLCAIYPDGHRLCMLADISDRLRQDKRALVRGYRAAMAIAAKKNAPLHAVADPAIPKSAQFLEHLGFQKLTGDLYQCLF